jgi:hypothetical protein
LLFSFQHESIARQSYPFLFLLRSRPFYFLMWLKVLQCLQLLLQHTLVSFVYSKSEYTLEAVSVSGRPTVYTITLHNYIRLSWNFVHRFVSSISRSSSKMRMIGQEMVELSKKLSLLIRPSLRGGGGTGIFFQKKYFSQNYLKHIWIDSVFNADSEYDIVDRIVIFIQLYLCRGVYVMMQESKRHELVSLSSSFVNQYCVTFQSVFVFIYSWLIFLLVFSF